jgi:osmotically-inducible protein OsmY
MSAGRIEKRRGGPPRGFEIEPSDEWREDYGRGGPVRSNEPERDYFFEQHAAEEEVSAAAESSPTADTARLKPFQFQKESFRGRGPLNYRPTDARIRERLCEILTDHADIDAADLTLDVECGIVKLQGTVRTAAMKNSLLAAIQDVHGVVGVVDHVECADKASL